MAESTIYYTLTDESPALATLFLILENINY